MIKTWFPKADRDQLHRMAERHARNLEIQRGIFDLSPNTPSDERLIVNYLRHACTDYDTDQTQERHREACEAIAAAYPWLAEECARQIQVRAEREEEAARFLEDFLEEKERRRAERKKIIAASHDAAKRLRVGQVVLYRTRGRVYDATITKIGRTRVTLTYRLKSGEERTAIVHAALVTPADQ